MRLENFRLTIKRGGAQGLGGRGRCRSQVPTVRSNRGDRVGRGKRQPRVEWDGSVGCLYHGEKAGGGAFTATHEEVLVLFAPQAAAANANARAEQS